LFETTFSIVSKLIHASSPPFNLIIYVIFIIIKKNNMSAEKTTEMQTIEIFSMMERAFNKFQSTEDEQPEHS